MLRYAKLNLLVTTIALVTVTGTVLAQDWAGRGRLRGQVLDPNDEPIEGATVTLLRNGEEGRGPEPFTTNKRGRWSYTGLTSGSWTVRIEYEGYRTSEGTTSVNEFAIGPEFKTVLNPDLEAQQAKERAAIVGALEEGNQLLQQGEYAAARAKYHEALQELDEKQHAPVLQAVAASYMGEGNWAEARRRYEELLPTAPDDQKSVMLRDIARSYYEEDQIDQAVATLEQALATHPDDVDTLKLIINILVAKGREQDAQPYMERLPEGEKVDANALLNLGITAYNNGDLDEALKHFDKVVIENPDNPDAYYYRGLVYLGKGENVAAIADLEKLLELAPEHANAGEAQQFLEYLKSQ